MSGRDSPHTARRRFLRAQYNLGTTQVATLSQLPASLMSKVALPGLTAPKNTMSTTSAAPKNTMADLTAKKKNPFNTFAEWTADELKDVTVVFGDVNETTTDFTRKKEPNARYWKVAVSFKHGAHQSRIIKMNNCDVPFLKSTAYGDNYMYAHLQKAVADKIVKAALDAGIKANHIDKKVHSDDNSWWATINGISGKIGVVDSNGSFDPKPLKAILAKTQKGVTLNLDVVFSLKLSTSGQASRTPKDVFNIAVDCSRGAIKAVAVDVEAPVVDGSIPMQPAARQDIASQELIDAIDALVI